MAKSTKRPKGYIDWTPADHVMQVLVACREVLNEYRSYGPMTVRQIFYRLVGQYGYSKTERAYKNLAEYLVKARRGGYISFDDIRDDGTTEEGTARTPDLQSKKHFWQTIRTYADHYKLDRLLNQEYQIELWCEAAGMAPMLANITDEWSIPIYSTGGFSSVTVTHEVAQRIVERDRPTVFLHIGDYDPSGQSIFESMAEDIASFVADDVGEWMDPDTFEVAGHFEPVRVALTRDQVATYNLPTAPAKATDSRSANWFDSTRRRLCHPTCTQQSCIMPCSTTSMRGILEETLEQEREDTASIAKVLKGVDTA